MKPYYSSNGITIYHGAAENLLHELDCSVGLCFNELPFNWQGGPEKNYVRFVEIITATQIRLLRSGGNFAVLNNPANFFRTAHCYQSLIFRNQIPLIRGQAFFPAWHLGFQHNALWLLAKDDNKATWNGARENNKPGLTDVWGDMAYYSGIHTAGVFHPQAIPLWLARRVVELNSNPGDTVLDPTAGTGTIGLACRETARQYIGIELREDCCEAMARRFAQDVLLTT